MTSLIAGIYLAFSRVQAESRASQRLLNDSQYALEMMARESRNSLIFHLSPQGPVCQDKLGPGINNCILLLKEEGLLTAFVLVENILYHVILSCDQNYENCSTWNSNNSYTAALLGSEINNVSVEELEFYIRPQTDPYSGYSDLQPRVTIKLKTEYASQRVIEQVSSNLQTSVSSRIYRR